MPNKHHRPISRDCFKVAIIYALPFEGAAIEALLDEHYEKDGLRYGKAAGDLNEYVTGRLGNHNVVLASMPGMGIVSASAVAAHLHYSFKGIQIGFVVGICGGVPTTADGTDIFLGDVLISTSVIQMDFGRQYPGGRLLRKRVEDTLGRPNPEVRAFTAKLSTIRSRRILQDKIHRLVTRISTADGLRGAAYPGAEHDRLYPSGYQHKHWGNPGVCAVCQNQEDDVCEAALWSSCELLGCDDSLLVARKRTQGARLFAPDNGKISTADMSEAQKPWVHLGRIACGNRVIKSALYRDQLAAENDVIGFEMESAGIWDFIPTIVIKGVCDYSDSHKSKRWQKYAAATAAACTQAILEDWRGVDAYTNQSDTESDGRRVDNSTIVRDAPPKAPFSIPFRRDANFVDCGAVLDQIHQRCSVPGSRVALTGLGGVGKSQLAIEYAYQIRDQSPTMSIFWIHASSVTRFEQSFHEVADEANIPERNEPDANVFQLVYDWLRHHAKEKWMLILDNLDDTALLEARDKQSSAVSSKSLMSYIPRSQNGSILITTRSTDIAFKLVEAQDVLQVEPMDKESALVLLQMKLGAAWKGNNAEAAAKLVRVLGYMPLAIVQAAAFISQRTPQYSVEQCLERFMRSDIGKTTLLNYNGGNLRRDREAPNSIILTWQISFDYIHQARPFAVDLLSLMSFFDHEVIPEMLLRGGSLVGMGNAVNRRSNSSSDSSDDNGAEHTLQLSGKDEFEDAINMLRSYSFISVNLNSQSFAMHALVQLATRKWLEEHGTLEKWKRQAIDNLYAMFPTGESKNRAECQALFPHVKSIVLQQPREVENSRNWASLLCRAAEYAIERGNMDDAITMSALSVKARIEISGYEDEETLASMRLLGLAYSLGGRWVQAEEMQIQVLEISMSMLGRKHPSTLINMNNLASTYRNQGRWTEAEELNVQAVEAFKQMLGSEHPDTITSIVNLASTYQNQGRWIEAEELNIQALETLKRVLGEEHPDTLTCMNNLTSTYRNQGRWEEAEALNNQVLETLKRVLGHEHPDTVTSLRNLALTYHDQGRWTEAEELNLQVVDISIRVLGVEHPLTLISMNNLAMTSVYRGRWKEAELLETQVLEVSKRVLGEEHPDTLSSMHNLALIWKESGKDDEAIDLMRECLRLRQDVIGVHHPLTQSSSESLAEWQAENPDIGRLTTQSEAAVVGTSDTG